MTAVTDRPAPVAVAAGGSPDVPPIPFARLLRVEWRKSTDTRAARWLLALVAVLTAGVLAVPLAVESIDQTYSGYAGIASLALTMLLPVVTILSATAEWSQRTAAVTFTLEPRRLHVLMAKLSCALLLSLLGAAFLFAVSAAGLAGSSLLGRDVEWSLGWEPVAGTTVYVVLNLAMALAFGFLLHNSAASIVLYYLLPMAWGVLGAFAVFRTAGEWLNPSTTFGYVQSGQWSGHWAEIGVSFGLWIALPLVAGVARTLRREVS
jgi:ABC-2 type transport system permease protein